MNGPFTVTPLVSPDVPSLDDQLQAMAEHREKTGAGQAMNAISRAENLLRRVLTPAQIRALDLTFGQEPTDRQKQEGMMSAGWLEYNGCKLILAPYIDDMVWDPEQVLKVLSITPPEQPLRVDAQPHVLTNIIMPTPQGLGLVHQDVEPDKLYPKILETLLPYRKGATA